jgi:hypothetical protein
MKGLSLHGHGKGPRRARDDLRGLVLRRRLAALLAAAFLAACSSSNPTAPPDGSANGGDARADAPGGDNVSDADGPRAHADDDASDTSGAETGADGASACVPTCGHGRVCIDGACLPAPVVLARAPGCGAARLALGGGALYWTERATGVVKTLPLANTAPTPTPTLVAVDQMSPGPITADEAAVTWSNDGDRTIRMAPMGGASVDGGASDAPAADGGSPDGGVSEGGVSAGGGIPLLTAPAVVNGLLASGDVLYYSAGASAYQVPRAGGASTTLATFATCRASRPAALAVGGDYLFQTDFLLQFITRERTDGAQLGANPCVAADAGAPQIAVPETVTHSQGALLLDALYVAAGEVVWADHSTVTAKTVAFTAQTMSRGVTSSAGSNSITGFVVTGASVYLGESDDVSGGPTAHTVQVAPLGGADGGADTPAAKVVATGQPGASSFVADATHVYWVTHEPSVTAGAPDDCAIVSLAK